MPHPDHQGSARRTGFAFHIVAAQLDRMDPIFDFVFIDPHNKGELISEWVSGGVSGRSRHM
jgi:hypothetical protein